MSGSLNFKRTCQKESQDWLAVLLRSSEFKCQGLGFQICRFTAGLPVLRREGLTQVDSNYQASPKRCESRIQYGQYDSVEPGRTSIHVESHLSEARRAFLVNQANKLLLDVATLEP